MKKELTQEEQELMVTIRDKWINLAFEQKEIDKDKFETGIKWLYENLLKRENPKVVYCDSWLVCLITISILKKMKSDSVRASVSDSVRASVRDSVRASVSDSVRASVSDSVRDSVWDSVRDSVWDSVWGSVRASVRDSVRASVSDSVRDSELRTIFNDYSNYIDWSNFGWVSFYDYFTKIGVINHELFNNYKSLIESNAFITYSYNGIVFAIKPPQTITRNQEGILHDTSKPAIEFSDGTSYSFVNGRSVPEWVFTATLEQFQKEENEDIKAAIITIIKERDGNEGLLKFLNAECVDEKIINHFEGYTETVRLFKTKESFDFLQDRFGNMGQPYCWSEMKCPSTGSTYLIDNSADFTCAIEAIKFLRPSFVPQELTYKHLQFAN